MLTQRDALNRRVVPAAVVADFTGGVVLTGTARPADSGLTVVALDDGGEASTTDRGSRRVARTIYP